MFKTIAHYFLTLLCCTLVTGVYGTSINFEESKSFSEIADLAREKDKSFFVVFSAKWCAPCQIMNRTAFKDENLVNFIEENSIAVKADIDAPLGQKWQKELGVVGVPTIIFFDQHGTEISRITSGASGTRILNSLKNVHGIPTYEEAPVTQHTWNATFTGNSNPINSAIISNPNGSYELELGKYAAEIDIKRQLDVLGNDFERHQFYILQEQRIQRKVYTLIMSGFKNKTEALRAQSNLRNKNFEAKLVQL